MALPPPTLPIPISIPTPLLATSYQDFRKYTLICMAKYFELKAPSNSQREKSYGSFTGSAT